MYPFRVSSIAVSSQGTEKYTCKELKARLRSFEYIITTGSSKRWLNIFRRQIKCLSYKLELGSAERVSRAVPVSKHLESGEGKTPEACRPTVGLSERLCKAKISFALWIEKQEMALAEVLGILLGETVLKPESRGERESKGKLCDVCAHIWVCMCLL